ncbi:hypothetical protein Purlil1_11714 [Purpureocillium lilacinum]|uniref:Beta-lactamase-related domain-containing protein n=2 Tax=Purpureocillium lilacinum TaxID=33203 RepID=A0ABR0BIW7_PURLI|nr:hypothetical protein Purlil1_11714 [Purpureocillium lilacinum]
MTSSAIPSRAAPSVYKNKLKGRASKLGRVPTSAAYCQTGKSHARCGCGVCIATTTPIGSVSPCRPVAQPSSKRSTPGESGSALRSGTEMDFSRALSPVLGWKRQTGQGPWGAQPPATAIIAPAVTVQTGGRCAAGQIWGSSIANAQLTWDATPPRDVVTTPTNMALRKTALLLSSLAALHPSSSQPIDECPIFGASFPAAFNISATKAFSSARAAFPAAIEEQFSSGLLNRTHTVFAIDVFSTATNESVYSYFHVGDALKGAVVGGKLNDTTVSRVGSVTKLFTAYAILATAGIGVMDHPVTRYLPELGGNGAQSDPLERLRWEDVTVGALMSQQGGSGGVPGEVIQNCTGTPGECSIPDFLKLMRNEKRPTMPPFQRPLYSDGGWAILGRVLERLTNLPLNDALQKALSKPLDLNYTAYMKPPRNDTNAIVLPGSLDESSWGYDNQVISSSGGLYTSVADLRTVGLSILNSELLAPSTTRRWMHPLGSTTSLTFSVGAPWEIHRLAVPVTPKSNRTRIMDLYTKLGANAGYSSCIALSPDHGLGFSLMSVGATAGTDRITLRDLIGDVFLPAAEHAGAENAAANFAGTFVNEKTPGTNVTLTVDKGRPGLGLAKFFIDGMDVRGNVTTSPPPPGSKFAVRIYGAGSSSPDNLPSALYRTRGTVRYSFRAVVEKLPFKKHTAARGGKSLFMNECLSWFSVGFTENIDEFVLEVVDGKLRSVEHPLTKTVMKRVK